MKKIGIFPGSFDPLTLGHLDLIERGSKLFDELIVLVAVNTTKKGLFEPNERVTLIEEAVKGIKNVSVEVYSDGLVATYYRNKNAVALLRGVRNALDFEYESNIAIINRKQFESLETVLMYANEEYRYLSSSMIKEVAYFKGDISDMVPPNVRMAIEEKYGTLKDI
uniref:pantetheine-phosphate adenylyltransferase n=1 Tax=Globicatella sulfidifaciens TaxID=136093 RepID=UPI0023F190A8|nr:pantetheine-phosphate adenylyltransferase [Globicatella sulfidifaciens]